MNRMMTMALFLLAATACGGSGCPGWGWTAGRLTVTPDVVCPGHPVQVNWESTGSTVEVRAPDGTLISTARSGFATFTPSGSGSFSLQVDGATTTAPVDLHLGRQNLLIQASTTCGTLPRGLNGVLASWSPPRTFDRSIRVVSVSTGERELDIEHGGLWFSLGPYATTSLGGLPFDGPWTLESLLRGGESCVTAPTGLSLTAITECR